MPNSHHSLPDRRPRPRIRRFLAGVVGTCLVAVSALSVASSAQAYPGSGNGHAYGVGNGNAYGNGNGNGNGNGKGGASGSVARRATAGSPGPTWPTRRP